MYVPDGAEGINGKIPLCKSKTCTNRVTGVVYTKEYLDAQKGDVRCKQKQEIIKREFQSLVIALDYKAFLIYKKLIKHPETIMINRIGKNWIVEYKKG